MTIAIAVLAALAIAGLVALALRSQLAPGPRLTGRTVTVNTRKPDDQSIRGILVGQFADRVSLTDAIYLHPSGDERVPGVVHVPVANIAFIQEFEPVS